MREVHLHINKVQNYLLFEEKFFEWLSFQLAMIGHGTTVRICISSSNKISRKFWQPGSRNLSPLFSKSRIFIEIHPHTSKFLVYAFFNVQIPNYPHPNLLNHGRVHKAYASVAVTSFFCCYLFYY